MNKLLPSVKSLITLAALLCFLFQASAASAQKVSLSVRNATVKAAIERLQKDYGYSFVIKTKDADVNKKITLDVKNEEIGAVVGKMFAGQNVVSSVEGKMIAIMSAPAKRDAAARASANAVVKGVVKDSAGNPITGATVIVDGTTIGATTDLDGSFSVRIGARTDVRLIVSYLGLKTREVAVDDPARFRKDSVFPDSAIVVAYQAFLFAPLRAADRRRDVRSWSSGCRYLFASRISSPSTSMLSAVIWGCGSALSATSSVVSPESTSTPIAPALWAIWTSV